MAKILGIDGATASSEEIDDMDDDGLQDAIDVYVSLQRTADSVARCVDSKLSARGLTTAQYGILLHLVRRETLSLTELSELIFRSNSTITALIDRAERDGLVNRVAHEHDRRVTMVELTPEGKEMFMKVRDSHRRFLADVMSDLSFQEHVQLTRLLDKINGTVEKIGS